MIHLLFISYLRGAADSLFFGFDFNLYLRFVGTYRDIRNCILMEDAFKWISECLIQQNQQCSFAQDELRLSISYCANVLMCRL